MVEEYIYMLMAINMRENGLTIKRTERVLIHISHLVKSMMDNG
jgi:hypothetical protein